MVESGVWKLQVAWICASTLVARYKLLIGVDFGVVFRKKQSSGVEKLHFWWGIPSDFVEEGLLYEETPGFGLNRGESSSPFIFLVDVQLSRFHQVFTFFRSFVDTSVCI